MTSKKIPIIKKKSIEYIKTVNGNKRTHNYLPKPFLILMCNAIPYKQYICGELEKNNLCKLSNLTLDGFLGYAKQIYELKDNDEISLLWLATLFQEYYDKANEFEVIFFDGDIQIFNLLRQVKTEIREKIGNWNRQIKYNGQSYIIEQHYVHSPEISEAHCQYNHLLNCDIKNVFKE